MDKPQLSRRCVCVLQLAHSAFPVYVCTSVCTQLPCREINGLEAEKERREWKRGGERLPEGDVKLIPVLQFWSYLEKTGACVCVRTRMCVEEWFKPSAAGNVPFLQTHIGTMEQSWFEPNGYRHKQLEWHTKPASTCVKCTCFFYLQKRLDSMTSQRCYCVILFLKKSIHCSFTLVEQ